MHPWHPMPIDLLKTFLKTVNNNVGEFNSKNCKHVNGVVVPAHCFEEVAIFGIPVPSRPDLSVVNSTSACTLPTNNEDVVDRAISRVETICFDINLLSRILSKKLCTVKCIPLRWKDPMDRLGLVSDQLAQLTPSFNRVKKSNKHDEAYVVQCKRKLGDGHCTDAIRVLTSFGVAPYTPDTLHDLEAKHPYGPPLTLSSSPLSVDALFVDKDLVLNRIRSFPKGTLFGRDGLRAQHLMDILGGAAFTVAVDLLGSIARPGGGIRPIVVGTMWRRLVYKVASFSISNSMNTYSQDFKFCVDVPSGCEAILHYVNRLIESKGVQQGAPLGPLLFALALHPLLQNINQSFSLDEGFCQDLALKRVSKTILLMETIHKLHDPQSLRASLEKVVTTLSSGFSYWQWRLVTLLIELGGLGILLAGDIIWLSVPMFSEVRDILVDICSKVGIMVQKEAPMGFLWDDGKDLRHADLLLFNLLQGKDACLYVTCISPFASMGATSWALGVALHNAVEKKKKKYATICEENGYKFIPFSFSRFGEFDTKALDTLSRIKSISISHLNNVKSGVFIFHRVSFCIHKGVGAQLVSRLPSNFM
ncbi:hypothetical protein Tco_0863925 [Tanacetum coccineum]